jgi:hypothetical protein
MGFFKNQSIDVMNGEFSAKQLEDWIKVEVPPSYDQVTDRMAVLNAILKTVAGDWLDTDPRAALFLEASKALLSLLNAQDAQGE